MSDNKSSIDFKQNYNQSFSYSYRIEGEKKLNNCYKQYQEYIQVIEQYYDEKKKYINHTDQKNNILVEYFKMNPSHMRHMCQFVLNIIFAKLDPANIQDKLTKDEKETIETLKESHKKRKEEEEKKE